MPLGTEVGLGPGDIVLDGDPAPPRKGAAGYSSPPLFGPCLLWPQSPISGTAKLLLLFLSFSLLSFLIRSIFFLLLSIPSLSTMLDIGSTVSGHYECSEGGFRSQNGFLLSSE